MHLESLKKLISREFLKQALVPILIIELLLLVMYFSINYYISDKTKLAMLDSAKSSLVELSAKEASGINLKLSTISKGSRMLQDEGQRIFSQLKSQPLPSVKPVFAKHENGVYYKTNDNNGSSLFYSNLTKIDSYATEKALYSEALDSVFKSFVGANSDLAVGVYLNTFDSMNRYYPFLPDVYKVFDANMSIPDFNFYYEADLVHNPKKTTVWTDVYLDPAGQGWMSTCAVPVYNKDKLEGVIGVDITVEKFIKSILALELPWHSQAFLVNKGGTILAMTPKVEQLFGLTELKKHVYNDTVKKDTLKPEEFNLLKNKDKKLVEAIKPLLDGKEKLKTININDNDYIITSSTVEETGWKLFIIADNQVVLDDASSLKKLSNEIGIIAIVLMVGFYIVFFILLSKHSVSIAKEITKPIDELIEAVDQMARRTYTLKNFSSHGIEEIEKLSQSFNNMSIELNSLYDTLEDRITTEVGKNREKDTILLKQAKSVAMAELLSNIAHQWRQPLNIIALTIQELEMLDGDNELSHEDVKDSVSNIMQEVQFMSKTIDTFRTLFEGEDEIAVFEPQTNIEKAISILDDSMRSGAILIDRDYKSEGMIEASQNEFTQIMMNVLTNSREAFEGKNITEKRIKISTKTVSNNIQIDIIDNAGGIPEQIIDKIFEPYFTTKFKSQGVGLGLYTTRNAITNYGGTITARNDSGSAIISITLPITK